MSQCENTEGREWVCWWNWKNPNICLKTRRHTCRRRREIPFPKCSCCCELIWPRHSSEKTSRKLGLDINGICLKTALMLSPSLWFYCVHSNSQTQHFLCCLWYYLVVFHSEVQTKSFSCLIARSVNLQLYAGVSLRGIQWVDSTVAVVISSDPHLLSQLESNVSAAWGNITSVPQVHLAAEIKHQGLDTHTVYEICHSFEKQN